MDDFPHIERLSKDLRDATATMSDDEARFLVDAYYIIQEDRKRSGNQVRAMEGEPHATLAWFYSQNRLLEAELKAALDRYSDTKPIGIWMKEVYGIGPVIAAGLMAHIDIRKAPTAGHIWRFAGLDPNRQWLGKEKAAKLVNANLDPDRRARSDLTDAEVARISKAANVKPEQLLTYMTDRDTGKPSRAPAKAIKALAKRPWNAGLKTLCWHIGQSFMKFSNRDDCYYGKLYRGKKEAYVAKNEAGGYAVRAAIEIDKYGKNTDAYEHLSGGKLPPAQVDAMARRWVEKIFLSHVQEIWYELHFGKRPPNPFAIGQLGHAHYIPPPHWPASLLPRDHKPERAMET
jgi:hypothetical protein